MNNTFIGRWRSLTTPLLVVAVVVFGLAIAAQAADAARLPQWATVNNTSSVTVAPGASVSVKFNVTTNGSSSANDWESTSWKVATNPGGSFDCENTDNHTTDGNYTETFSINAPSTPGTYNLYLKAHDGNSCSNSGASGLFTLTNAITVLPPYGVESYESNYTTVKNDFYQGETVYGKGWKLNDNSYLRLVFRNPGNSVVKECDWNYDDHTTCSYNLPANAPLGEWDIKLQEWSVSHGWKDKELDHFNVLQANYCGDGQVNQAWEQCDGTDGVGDHQRCTNECQLVDVPYCGDNKVNQESEDCDGGDACTAECTWKPVQVNGYKIVCEDESDLPNWGPSGKQNEAYMNEPDEITSSTAATYAANSNGNCQVVENWNFQWGFNGEVDDPDKTATDNTFYGEAGGNFSTFSPSTSINVGDGRTVWFREVLPENYLPFTYRAQGDENTDDFTAEFYCGSDILNFDNYEYIDAQPGESYSCVGFNVMKTGTVTFYKDVRWNNSEVDVDDNQSFEVKVDGESVGYVSENSPLQVELPIGTHNAVEMGENGYAIINGESEFNVSYNENTDVYFENQLACSEGATWAYGVMDTDQGLKKNGSPVDANRSNALAALGPADGNAVGTFYSLGFGGSLTVKFQYSVIDGEGNDISVHETTNGTYPEETALVEVSYDGVTWYELGTASNLNAGADSYFDLSTIGLPVVNYVRLTDTSDASLHTSTADGFDVDAIDATHGMCENVQLYNIHGYKWYDVNGNGVRDCANQEEGNVNAAFIDVVQVERLDICEEYSEDLLPDWTVFIDENGNQTLDDGEMSTTTDSSEEHYGWYWFQNLLAGTYNVCEIVPTDWQQTFPYFDYSTMCHTVTLPYGNDGDTCYANYQPNAVESNSECNFGNRLAPELSIDKSVLVNGEESDIAEEGDVLSYTITVMNTGDAAATNLYIEDTTPTNTTLVSGSGDIGDATDNLDGSFTWGPFSLAGGDSLTVTFDVTVNDGLEVGVTEITNQATLYQAPDEELEATNFLQKLFGVRTANAAEIGWNKIAQSNIVLTTVTIPEPEVETPGVVLGDEALPGLSVEKTVGSAFTNPGGTVTYTVTVTNNGDALAENVTIIDTLPDGLHFTDTAAMDHSWVLGDILDGESASVSYDVVVDKDATAGNYINTVVAWAADVDNVTDTATLEVREPQVLGAETLPVTGAGIATLVISTLAGLGAVTLTNRKRK